MPGAVVFNDVALYGAALRSVMRKATRIGAETTAVEMVRSIEEGPATGRVYTSGPQPTPHQASAPGEAPANWTGQLRDSVRVEVEGRYNMRAVAGGAEAPYAVPLEFGTRHMAPRPFMEPAAEKGQEAEEAYLAEIAARLRKPGRVAPGELA